MLNLFLSFVLLYGVKSNVVVSVGAGVLTYQKEKQYLKFRVLNSLFLAVGIIVCLMISYILHSYVYKPYDLLYLNVVVSVLIVGIYNMIVSKIFAKMSHFSHYLYQSSYSYAVDFVFILSMIFVVDMAIYTIIEFLIMTATIAVVMFVSNLIFGFYIEDANKSNIDRHYLNVPSRLFMMAMFSIILYYASLLIK